MDDSVSRLEEMVEKLEDDLERAHAEIRDLRSQVNDAERRGFRSEAEATALTALLNLGPAVEKPQYTKRQMTRLVKQAVAQARVPFDRRIVERSVKFGADGAFEAFEEYLDPLFRENATMMLYIGHLLGVAVAGFNNVSKEQIKIIASVVEAWRKRAEFSDARASKYFGLNAVMDYSVVDQIIEAAKTYYVNDNSGGEELRAMAASLSRLHERLLVQRLTQNKQALFRADSMILEYRASGKSQTEAAKLARETLQQLGDIEAASKISEYGFKQSTINAERRNRDREWK